MQAINKIDWKGHTVEFIPVLSHKTFWVATLNELRFDGKLVATSGGFCFGSQARTTVEHEGRPVLLEMRSSSRRQSLVNLNYTLLVDGQVVSSGVAKTRIQW
jgi:hypothetical protein